MPYSITVGVAQIVPPEAFYRPFECTCAEAQHACMPSFVFSVPGQINFRRALVHLLTCPKRACASLRKKVRAGMSKKLHWLFQQEALLGCITVQPFLYRTNSVLNLDDKKNFTFVTKHLAHCPHESCARLRRALLLTVRSTVSPNTREKVLVLE